jgi:uncharacterized protein YcfJ
VRGFLAEMDRQGLLSCLTETSRPRCRTRQAGGRRRAPRRHRNRLDGPAAGPLVGGLRPAAAQAGCSSSR